MRHSRCRGKQSDPVEVQSDLGSAVVDEAPRANPGMSGWWDGGAGKKDRYVVTLSFAAV